MDVFSKEKRSQVMSRIRGKDTKPEKFIRNALHRIGYRYRLHVSDLPGKPDLVFPKYKAVIFVHGCFWHGHNCHLFKWPKSRVEFWETKIMKNRENDNNSVNNLKTLGWRILLVWECAIKGKTKLESAQIIEDVVQWLESEKNFKEILGR